MDSKPDKQRSGFEYVVAATMRYQDAEFQKWLNDGMSTTLAYLRKLNRPND